MTPALHELRNYFSEQRAKYWFHDNVYTDFIHFMTLSNDRITESFYLPSMSKLIFISFSSVVSTGKTLQISTWTSIAFVVDKPSSQVVVYINGKVAYDNSSIVVSKSHILDRNDLIGFYGGMEFFIFLVFFWGGGGFFFIFSQVDIEIV